MRESKTHVATPWDWRESEREQRTMGDIVRHLETPWNWERLLETASIHRRL